MRSIQVTVLPALFAPQILVSVSESICESTSQQLDEKIIEKPAQCLGMVIIPGADTGLVLRESSILSHVDLLGLEEVLLFL